MRIVVFLVACALASGQSLDQAYEALRAHNYDTAIAGFRKEVTATPTHTSVRKDLAYTYLRIGENQLAREQLREAMRLDPSDAQVALDYAFLCFESRQQAEARRIFDRLRKAGNPTAEMAFQNIEIPLAAGIDRWKKAIQMGADDFSAHYELASLAEQRDDLALAAEHYEKAWRLLPDRRSVLVDLGRVWKALNRPAPFDADATAALLAASRGGEPRAAEMARELLPDRYPYVAEFRHALDFDPKNAELRREFAFLLLRLNRQPEAEQELRLLADTPPGDLLAATQLAFLLHARGDQAGAKPLFDRVLASKNEELANRVRAVLRLPQASLDPKLMAERSLKAGYLKDAVRYLEAASEADPTDGQLLLQLGWTYNQMHQDVAAIHWFDLARKSDDPRIASEAQKAWHNLRSPTARFRTTGWMFPSFSSRWHDIFGYGQIKTEVRTGLGVRPYISVRMVGDTRQTEHTGAIAQYLSEDSVILAVGMATTPWHGVTAWGEAGQAFNYISRKGLHDYRGGLSVAYGRGHTLHSESPGWFASSASDAVFMSRFGNDLLFYNQERIGYTAGPPVFRAQVHAILGLTMDDQRQYWANFGEAGLGIRMGSSQLPQSMYLTFEAVRGVYLINDGNPRRPNFYDFRLGLWYAFTR